MKERAPHKFALDLWIDIMNFAAYDGAAADKDDPAFVKLSIRFAKATGWLPVWRRNVWDIEEF